MEPRSSRNRWFTALWLVFWGTASSVWCISAATQLSATFDEPFYIEQGLHFWRTGSHAKLMRAGTMPLPVDLQTLPLAILENVRGRAFDFNNDVAEMLPVARATNLVFWWLLMFYGLRVGR